MSIPGLIDKNVQEIDGQYRSDEGLVAVEDIYRCGIQESYGGCRQGIVLNA